MNRFLLLLILLLPVAVYAGSKVDLLIEAAEGGIPDAQYDLAVLYERGEGGVKQSAAKAKQWYEAAAKNGHAGAKVWLSAAVKREEADKAEQARRAAEATAARDKAAAEQVVRDKAAAEQAARDQARQLVGEMVSLSNFAIGKYEVTQKQWKAVMGSNPSNFSDCGDDCPVENVSWDDVQTFLNKLNQMTGSRYRLPTKQEWERACGTGTKYCGGNDPDAVAWYRGNSGSKTHPVGKKQTNANGLYDMSGNVSEMTSDCIGNDCGVRLTIGGDYYSTVDSGYDNLALQESSTPTLLLSLLLPNGIVKSSTGSTGGVHTNKGNMLIGLRLAQDL